MRARFGLQMFIRRVVVACVIVSVVTFGAVAFAARFDTQEFAKRTTVHLEGGILTPDTPARPANFLMFGRDDTGNSDTMMVVHVDPAVPTPFLVSFPRDLMVQIPGHGLRQLNSAYGLGGAALLIRTLEVDFHIPIQHYLQVDFSTFPQIIDAIGRVDVWFPTPVHDPYIGLDVEHAGCVALDGPTALKYVRSRHYYVPKNLAAPAPWSWDYSAQQGGQGWTAIGSDIDRIPRQQYFLRTVAQAAIQRTNDDPFRIIGLVDAVMTHLTTDQALTLNELKALVRTFGHLRPADIAMTTLPWASDPSNPNRVVVKYPDATPVLDELANFTPPRPFIPVILNPHTISVRVVNGSGVPGIAATVLHDLVSAGFRSAGPAANADSSNYIHSQVRWSPGEYSKGVTAVYATGVTKFGQSPNAADTLGGDVLIVVGRDWKSLTHHLTNLPGTRHVALGPVASKPARQPLPATTTTVDWRFIPVNPKGGGVLVGCPKQ